MESDTCGIMNVCLVLCPYNVKGINIGKHSGIQASWTHAHMRMTECDNKNEGGGAFAITYADPEAGVRGGSLCMYITPKDFLGKILEPTGYPYATLG